MTRKSSTRSSAMSKANHAASANQGPSNLLLGAIAGGLILLLGAGIFAVVSWNRPREKTDSKIARSDADSPKQKTDVKKQTTSTFNYTPPIEKKITTPTKESQPPTNKIPPPKKIEPPPTPAAKTTKTGDATIVENVANGLKIKVITTKVKETLTGRQGLRIGVSRPHYDDMGKLLTQLGSGYKYTQLDDQDLQRLKSLSRFNVVFLTCSTSGNSIPGMVNSIRDYVSQGGTLYASDLRFDVLARAFPEYLNPRGRGQKGRGRQNVRADVKDIGLTQLLGKTAQLHFNSGGWRPASFNRNKVKVYLEGSYETTTGNKSYAPFLVKFNHGDGVVIFTSFHNEKQNNDTEKKLLEYLVFTAVTAEIERDITKTMISGGFSPRQTRRLGLSAIEPKSAVYQHKQRGPLRFALGFRNETAKLRLTVISPAGQEIEREGKSTFTIEIDNADAGDWRYTISALSVPFDNFPFTLTVGEIKQP